MKQHSYLLPALAFIFLFAVFAVFYIKQGAQAPVPAPPAVLAADAGFINAEGARQTLQDFRGSIVLVNLWATWCPPCVAELPSLDMLQARLRDRNFAVVAISLDRKDMKTVTDFLAARHVENLKAYWDRDRQIAMKWKYAGVPVSFLLDRDGNVIAAFDGPQVWHEGEVFKKIEGAL